MSTTSNPVTEGGTHRYLVGGQRTNSKKRKTRDKLNATQDQGQTQSNTSPGTNSKQHKTRDKLKVTQDQGITTPDQRWALCVCTRGRVQGPPPMCVSWPMTKAMTYQCRHNQTKSKQHKTTTKASLTRNQTPHHNHTTHTSYTTPPTTPLGNRGNAQR